MWSEIIVYTYNTNNLINNQIHFTQTRFVLAVHILNHIHINHAIQRVRDVFVWDYDNLEIVFFQLLFSSFCTTNMKVVENRNFKNIVHIVQSINNSASENEIENTINDIVDLYAPELNVIYIHTNAWCIA